MSRTYTGVRRALAVAALGAATATVVTGPAEAATTPAGNTAAAHRHSGKIALVAGPSPRKLAAARAAGKADPPPYTCYFDIWEVSWPAGNPVPVSYSSGLSCGFSPGLDAAMWVRSSLKSAVTGGYWGVGPDVTNSVGISDISSKSTAMVQRPDKIQVRHESSILNTPDEEGNVDIWYYLPDFCTGVLTPFAQCDVTNEALQM